MTVQQMLDKLQRVEDKTQEVVAMLNPEGKGCLAINSVRDQFYITEDGFSVIVPEVGSVKAVCLWP